MDVCIFVYTHKKICYFLMLPLATQIIVELNNLYLYFHTQMFFVLIYCPQATL